MRFCCGCILLVIATCEACATSVGWNGEPVLKSIDGSPAICLPSDASEAFPVSRVLLSESYVNRPLGWELKLKPNAAPLVLKSGECFRFGQIPDGYEVDMPSRLKVLQKDITYVFMMDRINDARHYNYFYSTAFCVEGDVDAGYKYSQYVRLPDGGEVVPSCDATSRKESPPWK
ncbi:MULTISPECIES: hypothetical protein [Pseudomonas]|uniref:hypothetical protein n=1 Tax=Pseudomonas TaxID=286 RepID=UPI001112AB89|nr:MULTISPECIES: hypothetical protein [unclassified Pseudomonas]